MGLGPNEQHLLTQIEQALRGSDPKLAGKLAIFNRLTSREEMPLWERLLPRPSRLVRFAPMAMAAFVLCMLVISVTVLSRIGPPAGTADAACGIAWVQGCHAAGTSPHGAHGPGSGAGRR
jgi:Protein of unknown function (DUF3040)